MVKKNVESIPYNYPRIWSSATLYSKQDREMRRTWFNNWMGHRKNHDNFDILNFHKKKHSTTESNDIVMKRKNNLQTVSISQIKINAVYQTFYCHDFPYFTKVDFAC